VAYKLSIRAEAEADIAEAYQYYESCREGLGADFMLCIDESISRIQQRMQSDQQTAMRFVTVNMKC
jgi:hypothetical protein